MKPNFISTRSTFQFGLLLLTVYAVFVPLLPGMPASGLDESWQLGVNEALAKGMVFGRDLIFTFRPYASVYANKYHPAVEHSMLWSGFFLGSSFFLAAIINFSRITLGVMLVLILVLAVNFSFDPRFLVYPLLTFAALVRLDWRGSCTTTQYLGRLMLLLALFAPFGMIVLVKGSFLVTCLCGIIFSSLYLLRRKQWLLSLLVWLIPLVSMYSFWLLAGQPFDALPDYFISMMPIIAGYTEAMAYSGKVSEILLYLIAAISLLVVAAKELKVGNFDQVLLWGFLFVTVFISFKAGFVRHDMHALIAASSLVICAILICSLAYSRRALFVLGLSFVVWLVACFLHYKPQPVKALQLIGETYGNLIQGAYYRLFDADAISRLYAVKMADISKSGKFPLLKGRSDVYSYDQAYLISSGNDWRPRPVFQSYSAYTDKLAQLNKNYLQSPSAPDNIFLKIQPIDSRLPALEDGASWLPLWQKYHPVSQFNEYLLLKRNDHFPVVSFIPGVNKQRVAVFGEEINIPDSGDLIVMQVHMEKVFLGDLFSVLFKPTQLTAKLKLANGQVKSFRVVAGVMNSTFVISPLIESSQEFNVVYSKDKPLLEKKVVSIKFNSDADFMIWNANFSVEFQPYFIIHN